LQQDAHQQALQVIQAQLTKAQDEKAAMDRTHEAALAAVQRERDALTLACESQRNDTKRSHERALALVSDKVRRTKEQLAQIRQEKATASVPISASEAEIQRLREDVIDTNSRVVFLTHQWDRVRQELEDVAHARLNATTPTSADESRPISAWAATIHEVHPLRDMLGRMERLVRDDRLLHAANVHTMCINTRDFYRWSLRTTRPSAFDAKRLEMLVCTLEKLIHDTKKRLDGTDAHTRTLLLVGVDSRKGN
jgi:hypothetical protein